MHLSSCTFHGRKISFQNDVLRYYLLLYLLHQFFHQISYLTVALLNLLNVCFYSFFFRETCPAATSASSQHVSQFNSAVTDDPEGECVEL